MITVRKEGCEAAGSTGGNLARGLAHGQYQFWRPRQLVRRLEGACTDGGMLKAQGIAPDEPATILQFVCVFVSRAE